ncbi:MAG: mRNA interferase [bacterium]|nr:MAG: mRNA interferase [bacterium]KAF0149672.1 MAG: mRNA interferase [bacterium]KAF0169338.1 MAG: mRNA interferase [bacterium]TXT21388.1 MAG: mRNA interferase [bacterium]
MRRGEVWTANLNPNKGAEIGKIRPVLVIQDDRLNQTGLQTILVLPLTTQFRPAFAPMRVKLPARDRLVKDSYVMVEQTRVADRSRFGEGPLATLTAEEMAAVEKSLRTVMGML